ncbi:peptide chain release factor 1, mitochondrial isoform X2 [Rhinatrema bivittatum]|uniref:peptide chain release factor 1, mitochondrial isoform X2 n=1 Tax=Rhinatrema bivittatum TaxID=194408 RepID=UPI0011291670|nr:peptide chain release factor 1, mitochondrial isoform X2 [Rhinatrema bivittatum]
MPPKRKGRVRVFPSTPSLPPGQKTIPELTAICQGGGAKSPADEALLGASRLSWETTLSPPDLRTPSAPGQSLSLVNTNLNTVPVSSVSKLEGVDTVCHELGTSSEHGNSELQHVGEDIEGEELAGVQGGAAVSELIKAGPVTLESLWELVASYGPRFQGLTRQLNSMSGKLDKLSQEQEVKICENSSKISELQIAVKTSQNMCQALIQDKSATNRRVEFIENSLRRLNLRLLNFPKVIGESPRMTLRKYMLEGLKMTLDQIPCINKIYFLPFNRNRESNPPQVNLHNLTEILESSIEIYERATLLISLPSESDVSLVMKCYFQNINESFMGQKIQIFPDLSKTTQERRKAFLSMRQEVITLGAKFLLRYPCKGVVTYNRNVYIFYAPEQLRVFIDSRRGAFTTSSPNQGPG